MKKLMISALLAVFAAGVSIQPASGQTGIGLKNPEQEQSLLGNPNSGYSLLDPNRFKISNSYSISYLNGNGYSGSFGLLQTSIGYEIASPLYLQVDLGYLHQPLGLNKNLNVNDRVFPNFHLFYTPNRNFHLSVEYFSGPSNQSYYPWHPGGY